MSNPYQRLSPRLLDHFTPGSAQGSRSHHQRFLGIKDTLNPCGQSPQTEKIVKTLIAKYPKMLLQVLAAFTILSGSVNAVAGIIAQVGGVIQGCQEIAPHEGMNKWMKCDVTEEDTQSAGTNATYCSFVQLDIDVSTDVTFTIDSAYYTDVVNGVFILCDPWNNPADSSNKTLASAAAGD